MTSYVDAVGDRHVFYERTTSPRERVEIDRPERAARQNAHPLRARDRFGEWRQKPRRELLRGRTEIDRREHARDGPVCIGRESGPPIAQRKIRENRLVNSGWFKGERPRGTSARDSGEGVVERAAELGIACPPHGDCASEVDSGELPVAGRIVFQLRAATPVGSERGGPRGASVGREIIEAPRSAQLGNEAPRSATRGSERIPRAPGAHQKRDEGLCAPSVSAQEAVAPFV